MLQNGAIPTALRAATYFGLVKDDVSARPALKTKERLGQTRFNLLGPVAGDRRPASARSSCPRRSAPSGPQTHPGAP